MPVWQTIPVDEQPELTLARWQVFETAAGLRHFVGYAVENHEGRVSSAIVAFDATTMRGRTRSGRVYQLYGPPGFDTDADYVLAAWLAINDIAADSITFVGMERNATETGT